MCSQVLLLKEEAVVGSVAWSIDHIVGRSTGSESWPFGPSIGGIARPV
jgi:hypothetical protein